MALLSQLSRQALVYTLPPDFGARPFALPLAHRTRLRCKRFGAFWFCWRCLNFRWAARLGAWATSITPKPWLQGLCFAPVFLLVLSLLHLPLVHPGPPHFA